MILNFAQTGNSLAFPNRAAQQLADAFETRVLADGGIYEAEPCLVSRIQTLKNLGLWDKASAVWLPHGYKEGKFYAAKGGAGADLGFTRGGTKKRKGATYVEEVPYNLLQYSEQFDNAVWTKGSTTVTANATASPDGKITADGVFETTANAFHEIYQSTTKAGINIQYTISAYVKGIGRNFVILRATDGAGNGVGKYFNISTGVAGGVYSTGTGFTLNDFSIVSDNNGFYKLKIVITSNAGTSILSAVTITTADGGPEVFVGDVTKGFYGWGIQTIYGSVEKDYFATTNRQNVPALDYTNATCPSLSLEPARTNLLLQSEAFENASWTKGRATVTANTTAGPENLSTADALFETAETGAHFTSQKITKAAASLAYSYTIRIKPNGRDWARVSLSTGANGIGKYFNLTTGVVGSTFTAGTGFTLTGSKITPTANGFYICEINVTTDAGGDLDSYIVIATADGVESYAGDITKGLYLHGAQLEQAPYATSYIKTEAATVSRVADAIPALLPKGTNQALHSEAFDNAYWLKAATTVTADATTNHLGAATADKLLESALNDGHSIYRDFTKPAASFIYTISCHVKAAERNWFVLHCNDTGGNGIQRAFDVSTGIVGSGVLNGTGFSYISSSIEAKGNGWYRCSLTFSSSSATTLRTQLHVAVQDAPLTNYLGVVTNGLYIWGAQLEQGDEATTYVATTTAPVHNGTVIGQTEGTIYFEGSSFADLSGKDITISDGTTSNYIRFTFTYDAGPVYNVGATIVTGGVSQGGITRNFTTNTNYKIAVVYKSNYFAVFADGVKVGQDLTVVVPATAQIKFAHPDNTTPFYGNIRALVLSKTALTDAEAITLTQP